MGRWARRLTVLLRILVEDRICLAACLQQVGVAKLGRKPTKVACVGTE